jgi:hypothetical protein
LAKVMIDYEEKLYLALAALRGAGFAPVRLVLDRPARLGPTSVEWTLGEPARALNLDVAFEVDSEPHIIALKDARTFRAPIRLRKLARWLASDAGQREPLAMIPTYSVAKLRVVR